MNRQRAALVTLTALLVLVVAVAAAQARRPSSTRPAVPAATLPPGAFPCGYGTRCNDLRPTCTPGTPCSAAWPQAQIVSPTPLPYPTCPPDALCAPRAKPGR